MGKLIEKIKKVFGRKASGTTQEKPGKPASAEESKPQQEEPKTEEKPQEQQQPGA